MISCATNTIVNLIAQGVISFENAQKAIITGLKRYHGVEDLYFYKAFPASFDIDGYGSLLNLWSNIPDGESYKIWYASTDKNYAAEEFNNKGALDKVLSGQEKVYFKDTDREYKHLDELKHDYLALKLSGVVK
jgi:hypothetical protein